MNATEAAALASGDLSAEPDGPQSARATRQNLLRRVTVVDGDHRITATLRNLSESGAMLEGVWNMPAGHIVKIELFAGQSVTAQVRWARENRLCVEFHEPLKRRADGSYIVLKGQGSKPASRR